MPASHVTSLGEKRYSQLALHDTPPPLFLGGVTQIHALAPVSHRGGYSDKRLNLRICIDKLYEEGNLLS